MAQVKTSRRGNSSRVNQRLKHLENRDRWIVTRPRSQIAPTITNSFSIPLTVAVYENTTATETTTSWRVEDLVKAVEKTLDMSSSWNTMIDIQIKWLDVRSYVDAMADPLNIVFTVQLIDPMTDAHVKTESVVGSFQNQPRIRFTLPDAVSEHPFTWDGTAGTSSDLLKVKTSEKQTLWLFAHIVARISRVF